MYVKKKKNGSYQKKADQLMFMLIQRLTEEIYHTDILYQLKVLQQKILLDGLKLS